MGKVIMNCKIILLAIFILCFAGSSFAAYPEIKLLEKKEIKQNNAPVPYIICKSEEYKLSSSLERARVIITTEKRDMSEYTAKQLVETAYSAMEYLLENGFFQNTISLDVLLFESCGYDAMCIARVSVGDGKREAEGFSGKAFGPDKKTLQTLADMEKEKKGVKRSETPKDYENVAKKHKTTPQNIRNVVTDFIVNYTCSKDFYDEVSHTKAQKPR